MNRAWEITCINPGPTFNHYDLTTWIQANTSVSTRRVYPPRQSFTPCWNLSKHVFSSSNGSGNIFHHTRILQQRYKSRSKTQECTCWKAISKLAPSTTHAAYLPLERLLIHRNRLHPIHRNTYFTIYNEKCVESKLDNSHQSLYRTKISFIVASSIALLTTGSKRCEFEIDRVTEKKKASEAGRRMVEERGQTSLQTWSKIMWRQFALGQEEGIFWTKKKWTFSPPASESGRP